MASVAAPQCRYEAEDEASRTRRGAYRIRHRVRPPLVARPRWVDGAHLRTKNLEPADGVVITGFRTSLVALGVGFIAGLGLYYTHRSHQHTEKLFQHTRQKDREQAELTREGQVTERDVERSSFCPQKTSPSSSGESMPLSESGATRRRTESRSTRFSQPSSGITPPARRARGRQKRRRALGLGICAGRPLHPHQRQASAAV